MKYIHWALILLISGLFAMGQAQAQFKRGDAQSMLNNYPPGKKIFEGLAPGLDIRPFYDGANYCEEEWHVLALTWEAYVFAPTRPKAPLSTDCLDCLPDFFIWPFSNRTDASESLLQLNSYFVLDGVLVEDLHRTPVKPWIDPGALFFDEATGAFQGGYGQALGDYGRDQCGCAARVKTYALEWGRVLAPGELSLGEHSLQVIVTAPTESGEEVLFDLTATFTVHDC